MDMSKILVPLDGSPLAEEALHYALATRRPDDTLLLLRVVVMGTTVDYGHPLLVSEALDQLTEAARDYLKKLAEDFEPGAVLLLAHGHAATQIVRTAAAEQVDRIVMTSHCRRGAARWLLGSVAEQVMRHSICPVWLIPGADCSTGQNLLIPLDGSTLGESAIAHALTLPPGRAVLLAATDIIPGSPSRRLARMRHEIEEYKAADLERPAALLRKAGWQVECRVVDGGATRAILEAAEQMRANAILMSSHCRRGWRRLLNGSVAARVVRRSHCPVLLVPPDRNDSADYLALG